MRDSFHDDFVVYAPYKIKDSLSVKNGMLEVSQTEYESMSSYEEFAIWAYGEGHICTVENEGVLLKGAAQYNEILERTGPDTTLSQYRALQLEALKKVFPDAPEFQEGVIVGDKQISRWSSLDVAAQLQKMYESDQIDVSILDLEQEQWDDLVAKVERRLGKNDYYYEAAWFVLEDSIETYFKEAGIEKRMQTPLLDTVLGDSELGEGSITNHGELSITTPSGEISVSRFLDLEYPGVTISFGNEQVAVIEYDSANKTPQVLVWDGKDEEPVFRQKLTLGEESAIASKERLFERAKEAEGAFAKRAIEHNKTINREGIMDR